MATKTYEPASGIGHRLSEVQRLKLEIDRLSEELEDHKAYLLGHAIRNDLDSLKCGAVTLSRRTRTTWVYSSSIKQAERRLKDRKQAEQDNGTAQAETTEHAVVSFSARIALANTALV